MKAFALVGYPLGHTLSPFLHGLVYQAWELPHVYLPWEVIPSELESAVQMFRRNLAGFNVTAPHKKNIMGLLDDLHLSAQLYGAVNTVKNENGQLIGYNTDGAGFLRGLQEVGYDIFAKRVLLLGAGGAAQTVALELAHQGCNLTIANREVQHAYQLQVLLEKRFPKVQVEVANLARVPRHRYHTVINATPVGMGALAGETPLEARYLEDVELVYDLIYNPPNTPLLKLAKGMGCTTINGLTMLVYQGLEAAQIWLDRKIDPDLEVEIYAAVAKEVGQ